MVHGGAPDRGPGGAAFPYFFVAFASAGLQAVIPQHHFAGLPDDQRFTWTSACLLLGALARLAGVWASGRLRPDASATLVAAVGFGVAFAVSVLHPPDVLFVAVFAAANGLSQLVFDALDRRLVRGGSGVEAHARAATALQLLGFVTGPAWFGVLAGARWPHLALIGAGTVVLAAVAWSAPSGVEEREPARATGGRLGADEVAFLLFALCTYAAMFVFVSSFVPVVRDRYGIPDATAVAGIGLALTNGVAVATVALARRAGGEATDDASWRPGAQLRSVLALAVCLVLLALRPVGGVAFLYALAVPVGVAYGSFLLRARAFASARTLLPGRGAFLSWYNNLSNGSALLAFVGTLGLSGAARTIGAPFLSLALGASAALAGSAAAVALWASAAEGARR